MACKNGLTPIIFFKPWLQAQHLQITNCLHATYDTKRTNIPASYRSICFYLFTAASH